jgi:DNA repair protein RadC
MNKRPDELAEAAMPALRVRDRFIRVGGDAFEDYKLLELVSHLIIPQGDTKPLAKALLKEIGSFSGVLAASAARLE